jgi:AmmeMemoRadiSam system protein B
MRQTLAGPGREEEMIRPCILAGTFYPAAPRDLAASVDAWLAKGGPAADRPAGEAMVMLPHAGHVFCGRVIGETLARVALHDRIVILCPSHTGEAGLSVWDKGAWRTPLGAVPVDAELADLLLAGNGGFTANRAAHAREHSIEVLLPFLQRRIPGAAIVPVVVSVPPQKLAAAGQALAAVFRQVSDQGRPASLIVSSDMHHFGDVETTLRLDEVALNALCLLEPATLYNTVVRERISMCGVQPATLALFAAREMGAGNARVIAHTTSAEASGDTRRVVGYAGVVIACGPPERDGAV